MSNKSVLTALEAIVAMTKESKQLADMRERGGYLPVEISACVERYYASVALADEAIAQLKRDQLRVAAREATIDDISEVRFVRP
jgi:hypothetical protein